MAANFKIDQSVEEMLDRMNNSGANTELIHAGAVFIQYKLQEKLLVDQRAMHQELLNTQNSYNKKQLFWSRALAIATFILALATILLVKFH